MYSLLTPKTIGSIRQACVFGPSANESIFITHNDEMFAFGLNNCGCLGTGDGQRTLQPKRVENLQGQKVVGLSYGSGPHVLLVTEDGRLYSWGYNKFGQLGHGTLSRLGLSPELVTINLQNKLVVRVACGARHSLAVTQDGEVFAWGHNNAGQCGSGSFTNEIYPRKVCSALQDKIVVGISCGQMSSMAIVDSGVVYGWGDNVNGQLGIGNHRNQLTPKPLLSIQGLCIEQLCSGASHCLALTDKGTVYAWGSNTYGQLGIGGRSSQLYPVQVMFTNVRVIEIAACHSTNTSAAKTANGKVYMWGQCSGQSVFTPYLTHFTNTDDIFACFATPPVMWRMRNLEQDDFLTIKETLRDNFDNPATADVKFSIDGKFIYAHKALLKLRCKHFQSHGMTDEQGVIEISQFSYPVYRAFLQFLYTDTISISHDNVISLYELAASHCEIGLQRLCYSIIMRSINVKNAFMILSRTMELQAKDLKDVCFRFCVDHLTQVTQTEAFQQLDTEILKEFFDRASRCGAFNR